MSLGRGKKERRPPSEAPASFTDCFISKTSQRENVGRQNIMTAGIWTEEVRVRSYDVTPQGTASVLALADYFQEAAGQHAAELGVSVEDLQENGQAWVLARLQMQMDRLPRRNETITLETWPSGLEGAFAHREFVVRDGTDTVLAGGTSRWFVIDVERRRPVRPPRALYDINVPNRPSPIETELNDLPTLSRVDHEQAFTARYHDLDLNRHVNNVRYLEWALETLPAAVLDERRCLALALQFESETTLGDPVQATAEQVEDGGTLRVRHRLAHAGSDQTLARAATTWL
jgi:medium-chain acyl-[acyl-carrier-protein] hydrolase